MNLQHENKIDLSSAIVHVLEQQGVIVSSECRTKIEEKLREISSYEPRIGLFGKTGVGKSSLCNALFGEDVCEISNIKSCTREPNQVILSAGRSNLKLFDFPGVGESGSRDKEYEELYERLLPELDLVLWVLKGDDRAFSSDESCYQKIVRPYIEKGKPFLMVINQVDKIEPYREWDEEKGKPGEKQAKNIEEKRIAVAEFFQIDSAQVLTVSANERYGLTELVDSIVHILPDDKKIIVLEKIEKAEEVELAKAKAEEAKARAEEAKARAEEAKAHVIAEESRNKAKIEEAKVEQLAIAAKIEAASEERRIAVAVAELEVARARLEETRKAAMIETTKAEEAKERLRAEEKKANEAAVYLEKKKNTTIVSEQAKVEAKKGWWSTLATTVQIGDVLTRSVEIFKSIFSK